MRNRIRPETKRKFRETIRDVIKGFSRKILIYRQPVKSECTSCFYDKMTNSSTGKCKWTAVEAQQRQAAWIAAGNSTVQYKYFLRGRCPVCLGKGYIETKRKRWVDCLVTWDPQQRGFGNQTIYTPAGTEGSTIVQLKSNPRYFDLFKNCDYLVVDGIECRLSRPPIFRGLGNQSVLIITAFTTDKSKVDSGELVKEYT
jgi:hypothetical protein